MTSFDASAVFLSEFETALANEEAKSGFPLESWFNSGRQKPETSRDWWQENGGSVVQRFIDWYEAHPDVTVWFTPGGTPAIELEIKAAFGDIDVNMAIDAVFRMGTALVVVDFKTSAKAPESNRQLGIYASGIEIAYGKQFRPKYGAYFLPRDEKPFQKPVDLSAPQYSVPYLTREFALMRKMTEQGLYLANPGKSCGRCPVAQACVAAGGADARRVDPAHPSRGRSALAP